MRTSWLASWWSFLALLLILSASAIVVSPTTLATGREDTLPKKFRRSPCAIMPLTVGYPNNGWQQRPIRLNKRRYLTIKKGSKNDGWGLCFA